MFKLTSRAKPNLIIIFDHLSDSMINKAYDITHFFLIIIILIIIIY